jgi:hypothetical protein
MMTLNISFVVFDVIHNNAWVIIVNSYSYIRPLKVKEVAVVVGFSHLGSPRSRSSFGIGCLSKTESEEEPR